MITSVNQFTFRVAKLFLLGGRDRDSRPVGMEVQLTERDTVTMEEVFNYADVSRFEEMSAQS